MAPEAPKFRYSNDAIMTSEAAKAFTWEEPVPVNNFWDSFVYCTARSFLWNFTDDEYAKLPINPDSSEDQRTKTLLCIELLKEKLEKEEAAASPPGFLHDTDYERWYRIWQGIYTMQDRIELPDAEGTVRMLVATRPEENLENNVVPPHMLADCLVKVGKYEEAEQVELPVLAWMDARPHLGKESPQAINARRIIARALWYQGPSRRGEAEALVAEIHAITEGMGEGKFGDYQEEEKKLNQDMLDEIKSKGI